MPELPEVETIARQLDQVLPGRVVAGVEVLREKSAQSDLSGLVGRRVERVWRRGKMVVVEMVRERMREEENERVSDEKLVLLVHLKMTGQLIFEDKLETRNTKSETNLEIRNSKLEFSSKRLVGGHPSGDWVGGLPSKHTRIVIRFEDGAVLYFNDMRVFGWMKIVDSSQWSVVSSEMVPDVVDEEFTSEYLASQLKRSGRGVKLAILDQQMMGGMGNIYANDALWWAEVDPRKPAKELKRDEVERLHGAMVKVILRGIESGGATISDYKQTDGMGGRYQEETPTYMRDGENCLREGCGGVIEKIKLGGRGTYYCGVCQVVG